MPGVERRVARRVVVAVGALLLAGGTVGLSEPAGATGTDVAVTYQGDVVHDGYQADVLAPPLSEVWSHNFGKQMSYPVIADQIAFVTVGDNTSSTYGTTLYGLSLATGSVVWSVPLGGTYYWSGLAYDNGQLFALNYNGQLQAFDPLTGTRRWSTQLPGQSSFSSAPTARNGYVYTAGAGIGGTLYAVQESSGTVAWTASVMNGDESSPVVTSSGVYVSYACEQTYDFNPTSGDLIWHYATMCEGGGGKTPAVSDGQLYVRDNVLGDVILNASTGALAGTFSAGPIPGFSGSSGYFLSGSTLSAYNTASQATEWGFTGDGTLDSAPLVANGVVYEGSSSGNLYALSAATGAVQWSGNVGSAILAPDEQNVSHPLTGMAVGEGVLLVPASDTLVAYQSAATESATAPSAPQALTANASSNQVSLSWSPPAADGGDPVTGYDVYRGTSSGGETLLTGVGSSTTSYVDSAVSLGSSYYYEVTATNAVGPSPPSNEVSATVATVPGSPTDLIASAGNSQVALSWTDPSSDGGLAITGYEVFDATSSGGENYYGNPACYASGATATSCKVTGLTNGTEVYFTVVATNAEGNSTPSKEASAIPETGYLSSGQELTAGQSITSPKGKFTLDMQSDGNLVEYDASNNPVWASGTSGNPGAYAVMQGDGNLVVYSSSNAPLFATGTNGNPGAYLVLGDDGELVVNSSSDRPLWAMPGILVPDTGLTAGGSIRTPNGQYRMTMQSDGNLVEYDASNNPVWASGTSANPGAYAVMQGDGNLVVYSSSNAPLFATGTNGNPGAYLVLGDTGQLTIYSPSAAVLWTGP
jgi:outer membrane protein assembly factor BamB